jgi:aminobenzoyl-glutamate transport protein
MEKEILNEKQSNFDKFIDIVEKVGNKLPQPFWLFVGLIFITMVLSAILSAAGVEITYMKASKVATEAPKEVTVAVTNLFSKDALRSIMMKFSRTFSGFAPLCDVIIMMLSIGMVEQTGMLSALIRKLLLGAKPSVMLLVLSLVGVCGNLASDAGLVIIPTVGAAIFSSLGLNPWIAIIVGFAAVNGGWSANLFIASTDVMLSGITQSVTSTISELNFVASPLMNYYYMAAATFVMVAITVMIARHYTAPRYGLYTSSYNKCALDEHKLTPEEEKGLKVCGIASLIFIIALVALCLLPDSFLRNDDGTLLPTSPILSSITFWLFCFFMVDGISYGLASGKMKSLNDVPKYMQQGVTYALSFIVVALPCSVFLQVFSESNISMIIAEIGSQILQSVNFTGFPLLVVFVLTVTFINIFIGSASAKWLLLAPVFVPMFAKLGFSPALTQVAYRIADMPTGIISPMDYYLPVVIGLLVSYNPEPERKRKIGMGTVISMCMPYTIGYLVGMLALLFVFYVFDIPVGPGYPLHI